MLAFGSLNFFWLSSSSDSSANAAHAAAGELKIRFADVVTIFLLRHDVVEIIAQLCVRRTAAQARTQIVFGHAEQAGANFSVGSKANAIAMAAEWFGHRRDDPNFRRATDAP